MVRRAESTKKISHDYRMPSAEDYCSPIIEKLSKDFKDLVLCDAQAPPTSDARKILDNVWSGDDRSEMELIINAKKLLNDWYLEDYPSGMEPIIDAEKMLNDGCPEDYPSGLEPTIDSEESMNDCCSEDYPSELKPTIDSEESMNDWCSYDYSSELEPTSSQEMLGVENTSRACISEGIGVVKEKRCMLEELPPEVIGQILANIDQGGIANFRLASRYCARYGLEYLFTNGKAQLSLCHELGCGMNTLTKKNVSWRIENLELYGDIREQSFGDCQKPGHIHFHDRSMFGERVHRLNNLQSLELQLECRPKIPLYIHLAASFQMSCFLLHILIVHRSPIIKLRLLNVGWWISYEEGTKPAKAISNLERFELFGDLDRLDYYGDILSYLQFMTGLKQLVIHFGMDSVNAPWELSFICDMKFHHLRTVCFSNVCARKDKLLQFFENHTRLRDIHIGTILLLNGSWPRTIHAMAEILRDLRYITFSGLQFFTRGEEVYSGYICSNSLNTYIKHFAWQVVRLDRQARERRITVEMLRQERSVRKKKAAAGNLGAGDICGTCGFLMEFCTRLT